MTQLQIIRKLWSIIYDLIFLCKGSKNKTLKEIEKDMEIAEYYCHIYAE